ncbi:hypothetical protein BDL97_14G092800 [Sphagnum fallax]|nr:hypothetical protein BDL97_14G092800 [Sphagnum fallax]
MVHNAFDAVQIIKDSTVKIESIGLWGPRLLVGCMDGSLRIYAPDSLLDDGGDYGYSRQQGEEEEKEKEQQQQLTLKPSSSRQSLYVLRDTRIGFSKKAVVAMDVLQSRSLLISLSDAVSVHTLPDFDVVAHLTKSKGASMYAWDEERGMLCVAKAKRLFLYRYDGSRDFTEVKELPVLDVVKSMAWCGESLCLGIRREYVIMNTVTGATVDVFPCGRFAAPLVVSLNNDELLLGKDNIGVFVDHNGKLTHSNEGNLSWSEAPGGIVIYAPYTLARLSRFIEVRSLRPPYGLVQTLPLREVELLLATDAGLVAATTHSVYRLLPVPIGVQVVQLAASGNYNDALALCKLLPPEDAALRAAKEDAIHIRYGQYLFDEKEYSAAMDHFAASSLDLTTILRLFPSIKLPAVGIIYNKEIGNSTELAESESEPEEPATEKPVASSSSDHAADSVESTLPPNNTLSPNEANPPDARETKIALGALVMFFMKKRGAVIEKAEAEDTEATVAAMVAGAQHRRVKSSEKYAEPDVETKAKKQQHSARELAIVLDTALIQALLATDNLTTALQLLSGPNFADVGACEDVMLAGGHYRELLQLYKCNHDHRPALLLLNRLAEHPESFPVPPKDPTQFGSKAIVDYLQSLEGVEHSLVMDCSTWILKNNPEDALKLFITLDPPLPPALVLSHLKENEPHLQMSYLEQVMQHHPELNSLDLQNELVQLYLSKVLEERSDLNSQGKWDERQHSEVRQKLLAALESSSYNAERVLQRLPVNGLYEERAFLLGRMRQHRLALTLYAHKLHESERALAYCDRVFQSSSPGLWNSTNTLSPLAPGSQPKDPAAANIYLTLLDVYLKPQAAINEFDRSIASLAPLRGFVNQRTNVTPRMKGTKKIAQIEEGAYYSGQSVSSESAVDSGRSEGEAETLEQQSTVSAEGIMLEEALGLLSSRWERLDGAQALRMLPSDTKLQVQEERMQARKRMVKVTSDRTCSICHKRIGSSVFAVYPNGTLVHFVCFRDPQSKPAAGP